VGALSHRGAKLPAGAPTATASVANRHDVATTLATQVGPFPKHMEPRILPAAGRNAAPGTALTLPDESLAGVRIARSRSSEITHHGA